MEADGMKLGDMGPLVAIVLGTSPFMNTIAYTPIFVSVNIQSGIPPFTSCLQLKSLTKRTTFYFMDLEFWGTLKKSLHAAHTSSSEDGI